MFVSASGVLVVFSRCRISANNKQVLGCSDSLVAGASRQDDDITRLEMEQLASFAAKTDKHFVCARMVVNIIVNSVAPRADPTVFASLSKTITWTRIFDPV
jgi:hypothetical protein